MTVRFRAHRRRAVDINVRKDSDLRCGFLVALPPWASRVLGVSPLPAVVAVGREGFIPTVDIR